MSHISAKVLEDENMNQISAKVLEDEHGEEVDDGRRYLFEPPAIDQRAEQVRNRCNLYITTNDLLEMPSLYRR